MVIILLSFGMRVVLGLSRSSKGSDYLVSGDETQIMRPNNWFIVMLGTELAQK